MSSSNNNNGEMMGIAIVCAIAWLAMLFVYALAVFAAFFFTGVAIYAWNKPRRVFGNVLTPREARAFVTNGIYGAILLPTFAVFCGAMFGTAIEDQYWVHIVLGGYALGSIGIAMMEGDSQPQHSNFNGMTIEGEPVRPAQPVPPPAPAAGGFAEQPAFRFASWDDEEELKR